MSAQTSSFWIEGQEFQAPEAPSGSSYHGLARPGSDHSRTPDEKDRRGVWKTPNDALGLIALSVSFGLRPSSRFPWFHESEYPRMAPTGVCWKVSNPPASGLGW